MEQDDQVRLQEALDQALDGDTIHLPGMEYTITSGNVWIEKGIVLVGTGISPDSTALTGRTRLTGNQDVVITNTANGLEIHGIAFAVAGGVDFGTIAATSNVNNVRLVRCNFETSLHLSTSGSPSLAVGTIIDGCVLPAGVNCGNAAGTFIRNCIVNGSSATLYSLRGAGDQVTVENCFLFDRADNTSNAGALYRNNIFLRSVEGPYTPTEQSYFVDNLWVGPTSLNMNGVLAGSNNQLATNIAAVFQTPIPSLDPFDWTSNYHPVPGSLGTTMAASEVGIYGGSALSAWKDGALPFNPHWDQFYAPGATNGGILQGVQLRGTAQTH